jgi:hypothetical protein
MKITIAILAMVASVQVFAKDQDCTSDARYFAANSAGTKPDELTYKSGPKKLAPGQYGTFVFTDHDGNRFSAACAPSTDGASGCDCGDN